jgi:putative oxidoreductase
MAVSRVFARPMLASMFLVGGFNAVKNPDKVAPRAQPVTDRLVPLLQKAVPMLPSDPATLARLNGGLQLVAGAALATGRAPRLSAAALALSLVPTTAAGHRFWEEQDPTTRANQRVHFFKNVSMLGGLIIASGDTEGHPGVLWRTRHAAKDARREARHLARSARREAALAKAKVT